MTSLRIVFAGTPNFAARLLQVLLHSHHQVVAVYTQPDRPSGRGRRIVASQVKQLASQHALPLYQPIRFDEQTIQDCLAIQADVMVVVAYGLIIPMIVLDHFPYGGINVHASLLPKWRGAAPIQCAILAGDQQTGITIMQMVEDLDCGDSLDQKTCPIMAQDTAETLSNTLVELGCKRLLVILDNMSQLDPIAQDNSKASYAPKLDKAIASIDWRQPAKQLERLVRALNPKPTAYTCWQGKRLKIWSSTALESSTKPIANLPVGTVLAFSSEGLDVITRDGVLRLLTVQLEGRTKMQVGNFFNAYRNSIFPGDTRFTYPA